MMVVPKPRRDGGCTGGPPLSFHSITRLEVGSSRHDHLDAAGGIGERAVFGGIGHHLVHDERQRRERLGIERDVGAAHLDPVCARAEIGAGLGLEQRSATRPAPSSGW